VESGFENVSVFELARPNHAFCGTVEVHAGRTRFAALGAVTGLTKLLVSPWYFVKPGSEKLENISPDLFAYKFISYKSIMY